MIGVEILMKYSSIVMIVGDDDEDSMMIED